MSVLEQSVNDQQFLYPDLLSNIYKVKENIHIHLNVGKLVVDQMGYLKNYGSMYFNCNIITNILIMVNVSKKYRVSFDSNDIDIFYGHAKKGDILFHCSRDGLCYYDKNKGNKTMANYAIKMVGYNSGRNT